MCLGTYGRPFKRASLPGANVVTLSSDAIQSFLYLRRLLLYASLKRFNSLERTTILSSSFQSEIRPFILCIEDNGVHLRLRKAVLEEAGYAVLSATDEAEALEVLREAPVCLVLSDHMLRGTTGTELAKQMKKIKRDVPIIVYSGMVPETMRHVDGFINKDEPVSNFLSLIHQFVKRYWE